MTRLALATVALILTGSVAAFDPECKVALDNSRVHGPPITITELEKIGMDLALRNLAQPQVPFSRANQHWIALRDAARAGDIVRAYDGPAGSDGKPIAGGYALIRGQCVVAQLYVWVA